MQEIAPCTVRPTEAACWAATSERPVPCHREQRPSSPYAVGSTGVPHDESAGTTPTTGHRPIFGRRPHRGYLQGLGLLEKLALQMAGSLPGNGSLLECRAEQTPQSHSDQNAPTHRTARRGPAPDAAPAWTKLWRA